MFLRKKKINHQTAKDGLEAVEKWRTGAFHLILVSASRWMSNDRPAEARRWIFSSP